VTGISDLVEFGKGKRFSQLFDLSFDLSMHDIFVCLYHRGTLIAASDFDILLPVKYIEKNKIDHWFSVPVLAEVTVRNFDKQPTEHQLKTALFCGEALPVSTAINFQTYFKPNASWNLYGPTEATIAFTARKIEPLPVDVNVFTVGKPFGANETAIELDSGDIVTSFTEGTEGEFLLGGGQVFNGYLPDTGSDVFATDADASYYRSGDLVRIENGEVCFIGRKDSQVKIRGHRVELGEIESAFRKATGVDLVVAFLTGDTFNPDIRLAYQSDTSVDIGDALKTRLPVYMLPTSIAHFETLPLNANGKIDRKTLASLVNG
jgi:non-ribosomal peptide synthetase component F